MSNRCRTVGYVIKHENTYLCNNGRFSEYLNKARLYEHEAYAWNAIDVRKWDSDKFQVVPVELTLLRVQIEGEN